jgi:hypothetical protein
MSFFFTGMDEAGRISAEIKPMPTKTPSVISTLVTVILLLLFGAAILLSLLVALNGYSEREAGPALTASFLCQGLGVILAAVLSWKLPRVFVEKFNWNPILSVMVSIPAGVLLGVLISSFSLFLGVLVADMLWK